MNKDVATWLVWLIQQQTISLGSPDARTHAELAAAALEALTAIIKEEDNGNA